MNMSFKDKNSAAATESLRFTGDSQSYSDTLVAESRTSHPRETRDNDDDDGVLTAEKEMRDAAASHNETRSSV